MKRVTALVIGPRDDRPGAIGPAAPSEVVPVASIGALVDRAREAATPWLWLIDSRAEPAADALDVLLDAGCDLAAGLPVDGAGQPVEALLGRFTEADVPAILDSLPRNRVPLRHTYVTSLLARREAILGERPPDPARFGRYAGSEWTWRLFARQPGMLIPHSRVRAPILAPGHPAHAVRMARAGVWGRGEALRELHRIVVDRYA